MLVQFNVFPQALQFVEVVVGIGAGGGLLIELIIC
jgi:hypothetical protein